MTFESKLQHLLIELSLVLAVLVVELAVAELVLQLVGKEEVLSFLPSQL